MEYRVSLNYHFGDTHPYFVKIICCEISSIYTIVFHISFPMFQFECNAKLLLNFITHPVFIHASRIVRFDNVDETHDVVFRDKACDDGIHGRVLPYTGRVHQHYPALQYIKEVTSGTLSEMDGN